VNAKKKNNNGTILEQYWNNTLTDTGTMLSLKKKNVCASREIQNVTKIFSKRENLILISDQNEYLFSLWKKRKIDMFI